MTYEELWPLTRGQQAGQSEPQAEQHRQELAREGVSWGLNRARIIERLRLRIQRDEAYLAFASARDSIPSPMTPSPAICVSSPLPLPTSTGTEANNRQRRV
jgi:hypothetical protein